MLLSKINENILNNNNLRSRNFKSITLNNIRVYYYKFLIRIQSNYNIIRLKFIRKVKTLYLNLISLT